jgi:hypothetical protein
LEVEPVGVIEGFRQVNHGHERSFVVYLDIMEGFLGENRGIMYDSPMKKTHMFKYYLIWCDWYGNRLDWRWFCKNNYKEILDENGQND